MKSIFQAWQPIEKLSSDVQSGKQSAVALVKQALRLTKEKDAEYHVVITLLEQAALSRAEEIDARVAKGEVVGRLAGVPFIAKDNFLVFGGETTAASNMLRGFNAPYQATAIERLEAEGAICIAKANLDAFAHGASTENSDYFVTKNPHDPSRVAGGSSGGSAAAVALGFVPFALGTDTGGSIREPASFCGVVGYKPTYGLVSRSGVVAMASSTDVIGVFATNVTDAALVLDCMCGRDPLDSTTIEKPALDLSVLNKADFKKQKFAVIKEYMSEGIDGEVKAQIMTAVRAIRDSGCVVDEVSIPSINLALAVYYIVVPAEISSNLSRYDGQRYQFSDSEAVSLEESYLRSRSKGFGAEAKRRIMIGTHVLSSGYYDAYYKRAQTVRTKLINEFKRAFEAYDVLLGPVTPDVAFKIGKNTEDPMKMYLVDIMTVSANLVGIPAISIPCGTANGMPVGLQLMMDQKKDPELLSVSQKVSELVL